MRNLNFFLALALVLLVMEVSTAQTASPTEDLLQRELGLRFSGFDDFNLMYKKELASGKYRRHRIAIGSVAYNTNRSDFDLNLGYAFGVEKRKIIKDKLSFISGPDFLMSLSYSNSEGVTGDRNNQVILAPALGYIIGFNLDVSPSVSISAEIIPSIGASFSIFDYSDNQYRVSANFSSTSTALVVAYKF